MNYWLFAFNIVTLGILISKNREISKIRSTEMMLDPVVRIRKEVANRLKRFLPMRDMYVTGVTYSGECPGWAPEEINTLIDTACELHETLTKEN